ncbi:hypothetical protein [Beijerinckia sp. L45]|uniref:hypothetical protein n=1 Tax=Beijerinckia sp. L45 TaxID=1641855 RepID=UPI00131D77DE|nr:hypothetical protein [Beijerinckia sp. L45]
MRSTLPDTTNVSWPADHEAVRFVVMTPPDRRGLQRVRSLAWVNGQQQLFDKTTSLNALLASARRRSVVFDVVDLCDEQALAA